MKSQSEISQFRKYFRWYVFALLFAVASSLVILYINQGYLSLEFVVGVMFISFLTSVVYLGTFILELQNEIEILKRENIKKAKKK